MPRSKRATRRVIRYRRCNTAVQTGHSGSATALSPYWARMVRDAETLRLIVKHAMCLTSPSPGFNRWVVDSVGDSFVGVQAKSLHTAVRRAAKGVKP